MKKRLISILIALVLISAMIPFTAVAERGVFSFEQIIPPTYEDASRFSDDLAAVKQNGKWGYINLKGEVVIGFQYDFASYFSEGYAVVGRYHMEPGAEDAGYMALGRIDEKGSYKPFMRYGYNWETDEYGLHELKVWDTPEQVLASLQNYYYYNGWVNITIWDWSWGVFNTNGDPFRTPGDRYRALFTPTEGLVPAWDDYEKGDSGLVYVNMNGRVVIDLTGYRYYDSSGRLLPDNPNWSDIAEIRYYTRALPFNQGLALVWECVEKRLDGDWDYEYRFGFINTSGRFVINAQFHDYWVRGPLGENRFFNDSGLASVGRDGLMGAVDKTGRVVVPFRYDNVLPFTEGLAVYEQNGRQGYIDTAGNIVIQARFIKASSFSNGVAVGYDGSKAFLIDRKGNMITGSDVVDSKNYFVEHEGGGITVYSPDEYVTITSGGRYGFGKISYIPELPEKSEMSDWAYDLVIEAIEADLVPANLQNMYRSNITRGDFSNLIIHAMCEMLDMTREELVLKKTGKTINAIISERKLSDSADRDVNIAFALNIVTGYEDGTFRPYNQIQRNEAAVMLMRAARELGMDITSPPRSPFVDRDNIASWAATGVDYVNSIGVMGGVGGNRFDQASQYSREQSYMTIIRLLKALLAEEG